MTLPGRPCDDAGMLQDALLEYFTGEKHAGIMVLIVGALALIGALLFFQPRWELRPFAVALGLLGLLELGVGVGLLLRTGPQVERLSAQLAHDPALLRADEAARMARVQRNFTALQYTWTALLVVVLAVALTQKGRPALWSASLGLLLHASFFLAFDLVAERRGAVYLDALTRGGD